MTDNEIVIALRSVAKNYEGKFVRTCETNINAMATDAANHIERLCDENNFLKAEVERLNETLDNIIRFLPACTDCEGKTPYGERTEKCVFEIDPSYCGKKAYELFVKMRTELETAKAEARKEFAEKLVAIYENDKTYDRPNAHTLVMTLFRNIDNLVKEMENKNNA